MKNTLRKILCAALAFIMAFAAVPAFAAEIGDTIMWYNDDGTVYDEYVLTDIVDVDDTITINAQSGSCTYSYILNAEKSGYYAVIDTGYPSIHFADDYKDGSAYGDYGYFDALDCSDDSIYPDAFIVYLEAGEVFFTAYVYDMESATVSFDFLGE